MDYPGSQGVQAASVSRASFYNRVFTLFGLSILGTAAGVLVGFEFLLPVYAAFPALAFIFWAGEIALILSSSWWRLKEPINHAIFGLFTVLSGLSVVPLLAMYVSEFAGFDIIYRALFATTAMFLAMAFIGHSIQRPLNGFVGFLVMGLFALIFTSLIGIFFPWGDAMEFYMTLFGMILFALWAIVDVNRLKTYPENEYVMAAMELYLDFFNLFLFILRLMSRARD